MSGARRSRRAAAAGRLALLLALSAALAAGAGAAEAASLWLVNAYLIDGRNALRHAVIPESATCVPIGRHFESQGVALAS